MERGAIRLHDDPFLDDQANPADTSDSDLRAHPESQLESDDPCDGFQTRFRSAVDEPDQMLHTSRKRVPELCQLSRMQLAQVQRTVYARDPCPMIEAARRLNQGIDESHVSPIDGGIHKSTPMQTGVVETSQPGCVRTDVHVGRG